MNEKPESKTKLVRLVISCIICAVLGAAPFVVGNILDWDIIVSVILMVVVSAPLSTTAFSILNKM